MRTIELGSDKTFPIVDPTSGIYVLKVLIHEFPRSSNRYYLIESDPKYNYRAIEILHYDYNTWDFVFNKLNYSNYMKNLQDVIKFLESWFSGSNFIIQLLNFDNNKEFCTTEELTPVNILSCMQLP